MTIDWTIHSISISKRWSSSTQGSERRLEEQQQVPETGTRYFLHVFFALQLFLQLTNAGIQHWDAPMYYCFIVLLHGPVLLFNVWVAQGFQEVMGKKFFQLIETKFDSVLSPMGGLTMHETQTISQDVKVSMMLPLAYAMLTFFWLAWYVLFDAAAFDQTIINGVDFDELDNIWGILGNVSAQAVYLNVYLVALHLVVPVFPLSGASFLAACMAGQGLGLRQSALIMDVCGSLVSLLLMMVGVQQTFLDDTNGIGVFVLFNAIILTTLCIKRRCLDPMENNELVCRSCYVEKESNKVEAHDNTESSDNDTGEGTTEKEFEIV